MGKHDKTIAESTEDFYQNEIKSLRDKLAFCNDTITELRTQVSRYERWISEIEASAQDENDALRAENEQLKKAVLKAALREVEA